MTIVAVTTEAAGVYCENSESPAFAHVYTTVIDSLGVTVAMYGLIAFYLTLKGDLAHYKLGFKIACIKLVIFFSFWQTVRHPPVLLEDIANLRRFSSLFSSQGMFSSLPRPSATGI
jgi:Organic solute transporter Ostalpha